MPVLAYDLSKLRASAPRLASWFSVTPTVDKAFGAALGGDRPVFEGARISGSIDLRAPANGFVRYGASTPDPQPSSSKAARDPVFTGLKGLCGEPFRPWAGDDQTLAHALVFEVFPQAWLRLQWMFQWLDRESDPEDGQTRAMRPIPHKLVLVPSDPSAYESMFSTAHGDFALGTPLPTFAESAAAKQIARATQLYVDAGTVLAKLGGGSVNLFVFDRHGWPIDPAYAVFAWKRIAAQFEGLTAEDDDLDRLLHSSGTAQLWVHEVGRSQTPAPGWIRAALRIGSDKLSGQGQHPVRSLSGYQVGTEVSASFDSNALTQLRKHGAVPLLAAPERSSPTPSKLLERDFIRLNLDDERMLLDPSCKPAVELTSLEIPDEQGSIYEGEVAKLHPLRPTKPTLHPSGRAVLDDIAASLANLSAPSEGKGRVELSSSRVDPRTRTRSVRERLGLAATQEWSEANHSWLNHAKDRFEAIAVRRGETPHLLLVGKPGELPEGAALFAWRLGMNLDTQGIERHPAVGRWVTSTGQPVLLVELPPLPDEILIDLVVVVWEAERAVARDTLTLRFDPPPSDASVELPEIAIALDDDQVELSWPAGLGTAWLVRPLLGSISSSTQTSTSVSDLGPHEPLLIGHGASLEQVPVFQWVEPSVAQLSAVPSSGSDSLGAAIQAIPKEFVTRIDTQVPDPLLEALAPQTTQALITGLAQRRLEHGLFVRSDKDRAVISTAPFVPGSVGAGPDRLPNLELPDHGEPLACGVGVTGPAAFEVHRALDDRVGGPVWTRIAAAADDELLTAPEQDADADASALCVLRTLSPGQFGAAFGPEGWPSVTQLDQVEQWINDILDQLDSSQLSLGQQTSSSLAEQGKAAAARVKAEILRLQKLDEHGLREGLEILVRLLQTARSLIYIETEQFDAYRLTEDDAWDSHEVNLAQVLHQVMVARPDLRIVICVPEAIEHPLGSFAETALAYARMWAVETLRYGGWGSAVEQASEFVDGDAPGEPGTLRQSRFADGLLPADRVLVIHPKNRRKIAWTIHGSTVVVDDEVIWLSTGGLSRRAQTYDSGLAACWSGTDRTADGVRSIRDFVRQRITALTGLEPPHTGWLEQTHELFRTLTTLAAAGRIAQLAKVVAKVHQPTSAWTTDGPPEATLALVDPDGTGAWATLLKLFPDGVSAPGHELTISFTHQLGDSVEFRLHFDRVIDGTRYPAAVAVEASPVVLRAVTAGTYELQLEAREAEAVVAQAQQTIVVNSDQEIELQL